MDLAIFVEGQYGLTWARWKRLARAIEDLGYAAVFRSDHFTLTAAAGSGRVGAVGLADLAG